MIESPSYTAASAAHATMAMDRPHGKGLLTSQMAWDNGGSPARLSTRANGSSYIGEMRPEKLKYSIFEFSSCNEKYPPHNILQNRPNDQASRWTTQFIDQSQFLTIQLEKTAVVQSLVFGKYHKPHVCNLREFHVYAGMTPDKMVEVFHGGLENNAEMETIALTYRTRGGAILPVRYLKIVPHASYQKDFPYSIWYLEVHGVADQHVVDQCYYDFLNWREAEIVRQCLKYFRQRNYTETFRSLVQETSMVLEDPLLSQLHDLLVTRGDFTAAEHLIGEVAERGVFNEYISEDSSCPQWHRMPSGTHICPSARGGHQMFLDADKDALYLYGGWDGNCDLGDLWVFHLETRTWKCLCANTQEAGGPGPRSCHKVCMDPQARCIYVLGKFMEPIQRTSAPDQPAQVNYDSDFWKYDLDSGTWTLLSPHTANENGPSLIYDHQMCMDAEGQTLYVFGGRVVTGDAKMQLYSGLFAYSIAQRSWKMLRHESLNQELQPRVCHAMVFHGPTKQLLVLGGNRNKEPMPHFLAYDIGKNMVIKLATSGAPEMALTQRAVLDPESDSLLVLSNVVARPGLRDLQTDLSWRRDSRIHSGTSSGASLLSPTSPASQSPNSSSGSHGLCLMRPALWIYRFQNGTWQKLPCGSGDRKPNGDNEPRPRYAHQITYDSRTKVVYMFGGNPDLRDAPTVRLDDFWELRLHRPNLDDVIRQCKLLIRKQRYLQVCQESGAFAALEYLQQTLAPLVDPRNSEEAAFLETLSTCLFLPEPTMQDSYSSRTELYDRLTEFFPRDMKQPLGSLVDYVPYV